MTTLEAAREALRVRQGATTRRDSPDAPGTDLALARLATAFFARKLSELNDDGLYEPSRVDGWTRAHVICDIAYQARAISRQIEAATAALPAARVQEPMLIAMEEIALGATLPPRALRHLFDHSAIHLDVVWRDLPGPGWQTAATGEDGGLRLLSTTPLERARRLWQRALDLGNGARLRDVPPALRPQ